MEPMHWGHFWLGVLCAYTVPWTLVGLIMGAARLCQRKREHAEVRRAVAELIGASRG